MRPQRIHSRLLGLRPGFTLIEVLFTTLLMSVVGMAIVGFMSAFVSGIQMRTTLSDPALEASLANRRLASVAPGFCYVLQTSAAGAAIWLSDSVPSRSVDLSELGVVYLDEATGMLMLETVDPLVITTNPGLDTAFEFHAMTDFIGAMAEQREAGRTARNVLAEGLQSASYSTTGLPSGHAMISLTFETGSARVALCPAFLEEPMR